MKKTTLNFRSMRLPRPFARLAHGALIALAAFSLAAPAQAYDVSGLDVPYVQTPDNVVNAMLDLANVKADDYVIDLGSGDGRLLIAAAVERGARGFGVDIDPGLVKLANQNARAAGVADRARFFERNVFDTDLSQASVIILYLLPEVNMKLRATLLKTLKPGSRVVSHDYGFGEWQPDRKITVDAPNKPVNRLKVSDLLFYVVPANAAGVWHWQHEGHNYMLDLTQRFQMLEGSLIVNGEKMPLRDARVEGTKVVLTAGSGDDAIELAGNLDDDVIKGSMIRGGVKHDWRALPW